MEYKNEGEDGKTQKKTHDEGVVKKRKERKRERIRWTHSQGDEKKTWYW